MEKRDCLDFNAQNWVCDCGERCDPLSPKWRFTGSSWEHYHDYPVGHVEARYETIEDRLIAALKKQKEGWSEKRKNYKIAPIDAVLRCDWLHCDHGMGLAGNGCCSACGDWSNPNCPDFDDKMRKEEEANKV